MRKEKRLGRFILALAVVVFFGGMSMTSTLESAATSLFATKIVRSGVTQSGQTCDVDNGNSIALAGGEYLEIYSGYASLTVYVVDQSVNSDGLAENVTVAMGVSETTVIGPFQKRFWGDSSGNLQVTFLGDSTTAYINVYRLPFGEPEGQTR